MNSEDRRRQQELRAADRIRREQKDAQQRRRSDVLGRLPAREPHDEPIPPALVRQAPFAAEHGTSTQEDDFPIQDGEFE